MLCDIFVGGDDYFVINYFSFRVSINDRISLLIKFRLNVFFFSRGV